MKQSFGLKLFQFLSLLCLLNPTILLAQDFIYSGTISTSPTTPYTNPLGAIIPSGNTVVINNASTTVQFNFGLRVEADAKLIVNGATIKVAAGEKIILNNGVQQVPTLGNPNGLQPGAYLELNTGTVITSVGNAPNQPLWGGIECSGAPFDLSYSTITHMNGATIRFAECAYRNFDPVQGYFLAHGILRAENTTFLNNQRMLDIGNTWYEEGPNGIWGDDITWMGCYAESCTFRLTADFQPPVIPPDMVFMFDGAGLILHSCDFIAEDYDAVNNAFNMDYVNNTTAIDASYYAIVWAEKQVGSTYGCQFSGFKNAIVVDNGIGAPYNTIVSNSKFACINGINLNSNKNPLIIGNESGGPITASTVSPFVAPDNCSIFLRNCPGMRVEGNNIYYDYNESARCYGIVAMNSGDADNVFYRNSVQVLTPGVGIESIGTNRAFDGTTGLKILCNNLNNPIDWSSSFNVAVMQDVLSNPLVNGIHDEQYDVNRSAGNLFQSNTGDLYSSYYLESGTNNMSTFTYKHDPAITFEKPPYNNIINLLSTGTINTCPVVLTREPQPSMAAAPSNVKAVTSLHVEEDDEEQQSRPAASGLSPEQIHNLSDMRATMKWLKQNNSNWAAMPSGMKETVYRVESKDAAQGGAMARGLLAHYEGRKYPPVVVLPEPNKPVLQPEIAIATAIYPNPAHDKTMVTWGGAPATLRIINIKGQTSLTQAIEKGMTTLDISYLVPGIYIVQIQNNNNQTYTQKLTIK